jgi:hypothetical protein
MVLLLVILIASALQALAGVDGTARQLAVPMPEPPVAESAAAINPWVEPAREVLSHASCGNCHRPGLPTSNPRALSVFNLHDPVWYAPMSEEQLRSLRRRIERSSEVEAEDQNSVLAFVDCKLEGTCGQGPAKESP